MFLTGKFRSSVDKTKRFILFSGGGEEGVAYRFKDSTVVYERCQRGH